QVRERLLHDILGGVAVAQEAEGQGCGPIAVAVVEGFEGCWFAAVAGEDQLLIGAGVGPGIVPWHGSERNRSWRTEGVPSARYARAHDARPDHQRRRVPNPRPRRLSSGGAL